MSGPNPSANRNGSLPSIRHTNFITLDRSTQKSIGSTRKFSEFKRCEI